MSIQVPGMLASKISVFTYHNYWILTYHCNETLIQKFPRRPENSKFLNGYPTVSSDKSTKFILAPGKLFIIQGWVTWKP